MFCVAKFWSLNTELTSCNRELCVPMQVPVHVPVPFESNVVHYKGIATWNFYDYIRKTGNCIVAYEKFIFMLT